MFMIILQIDNKRLRETYPGKYLSLAYRDIQQFMARWNFYLVKGTGCIFVGDNPCVSYKEEICIDVLSKLIQKHKWLAPALYEFNIFWADAEDEQRLCVLEMCGGLSHISMRGKLRTN
jgi:virulence-associated protein VapD